MDYDTITFKEYMEKRLEWFDYCQEATSETSVIIPFELNQPCQYLDPLMQRCITIATSSASLFERVFSIFLTVIVCDDEVLDSACKDNHCFDLLTVPKLHETICNQFEKAKIIKQDYITCLYNGIDGRQSVQNLTGDSLYQFVEIFLRNAPASLWRYSSVRDIYYSIANRSEFNFLTNRDIFNFARALSYVQELMIEDNLCDYKPEGYFKAMKEFGDLSNSKKYNHDKTIDKIIDYYMSLDHKTEYTKRFYPNDVLALIDSWQRLVLRPFRTTQQVDPKSLVGRIRYTRAWYDYEGNQKLLFEID
ncbi:hypothetical protein [Streptococcus hyointestinalis]|uniref:hypothetical protein n=1 Tax=Streptococcus hyointestinalis TaxID=1337 RepID=UPI0013DFE04E|nr:hypothetical protein [Streptococcus hyointestinalis]